MKLPSVGNRTRNALDLAVAVAIGHGIISEAEASPDLLELLRGGIDLAKRYANHDADDASNEK